MSPKVDNANVIRQLTATDVYLLFLYTSVDIFLAIYPAKLLSAGQRTDDCWPTYSCMVAGIQLYAAHRTIAPFCRTGKTHYKSIGICHKSSLRGIYKYTTPNDACLSPLAICKPCYYHFSATLWQMKWESALFCFFHISQYLCAE